ncbi:MAG: DinB family protein [Acidobacteria bacterium]|nr:DinB family protein [Acidobacteriota bacterium]MCH8268631.1 DinB family protein [Acidobacteriota bacterium]
MKQKRFLSKCCTLLACMAVSLSLQAQSTKSKERSIQDWEEFSNYTLRLAEAMPEESYDYRPHPDQMSFGEQIIEIATMSEFFFARIVGRTANFSQGQIPEKNAAIQISKESFAFCISALRSMSEEQLESTHILRRGLQMSGRAIIEFALSHAIHHSGQAAAYLGAKGIKVPPFHPLFPF